MRASLKRSLFLATLGLAVAGGLAYAFAPRPVPVDLAEIGRGDLVATVEGEGRTRIREVYTVSAPIAGRLQRVTLRPGDEVVAGRTVLTSLEETEPTFLDVRTRSRIEAEIQAASAGYALAQAELDNARAELAFAQSELRRVETLYRRGTATARAHEAAQLDAQRQESRVATAEASLRMRFFELETARAALIEPGEEARGAGAAARCCIPVRSPVSGQVLRVLRESEAVVQAGEPLIEIGDPADLEVVVELPSESAVPIPPRARVMLQGWVGGPELAGRVRRVEPFAFTKVSALGIEEQRVNVIVELLDPPEARAALGHGYRVFARIALQEVADAPLVPIGALFREGGDWAVFVESAGRAELRRIALGPMDGGHAVLREGLAEGERVVVHPSDRIGPGVRITPRD